MKSEINQNFTFFRLHIAVYIYALKYPLFVWLDFLICQCRENDCGRSEPFTSWLVEDSFLIFMIFASLNNTVKRYKLIELQNRLCCKLTYYAQVDNRCYSSLLLGYDMFPFPTLPLLLY